MRDSLHVVLKQLADNVVVLEASSAREAFAILRQGLDFELVLLDWQLPDADGAATLKKIREHFPAVPVAVVSGVNDEKIVREAQRGGAAGFVSKAASAQELLNALRLICAGGDHWPDVANHITQEPGDFGITERQLQVLMLIAEGKPNKVICETLGLAESTVKVHITAILKALGADNRTEAAAIARERGIL